VAAQKFANNASSLLAASITDVETTIQVDAGFGALFPNPGAGEYFVIALENALGDVEICKVTARATDLFTVVRGWEDTTAQAWTVGVTRVELRNTAGSMRQMIQRSGDTMEGDLNMDNYEITNAHLTGATIIGPGAIIQGATITNANGDTCNALEIPNNCDPPTVGGSPILTVQTFDPQSVFTAGMIMMWYGDVGGIPNGWALCDGNNGRPDLRNRFIVGVGSDYTIGAVGGDDLLTGLATGSSGAISGTTGEHTLSIDEIPSHSHYVWVCTGNKTSDANAFGRSGSQAIAGDSATPHGYIYDDGEDPLIQTTGGGTGHSHSISAAAHTHTIPTIDNRPPYYALYFIIKTDPAGDYGGVGSGGGGDGSMYDMYNESGCTTYIGGQATLMDDAVVTGTNVQINCCASNVFRIVLNGNYTLLPPNNPMSGQVINILVKQGGSHTLTFPANFKFAAGVTPTVTTGAGAKDIFTCQYDSADNEWLVTAVQSFA